MTCPKRFHGIVVPMVTPFTPEGDLDSGAVRRIVDFLVEGGVHGIFVLGTTGERASIPEEMQRTLVKVTVEQARGRTTVYSGIGDNCLARAIEFARESHSLGVDAVVAHPPSYYPLKPEEIFDCFTLLADRIPGALLLYNIPSTTHLSIPVETVARLAEHPKIVGFKDSENTTGRPEAVVRLLGGREDFSLFMGVGALSASALALGMDGLVPSSGNFEPQPWRELWNSAVGGDWDNARRLQVRLDGMAAVFQKGRSLGQSLAALKALMGLRGLCGPAVLPPLRPLESSEVEAIRDAFRQLQAAPDLQAPAGA